MSLLIKYWYLTLALIAAIILTVFVVDKASKAVRRSKREKEKYMAQLDHEMDLRKNFKALSDESFNTDSRGLLEGIGMNVQIRIEKDEDMNASFLHLPEPMQFVYALYILMSDCEEKGLEYFFRANGKPLTPVASQAAQKIIGGKFFELFRHDYMAYDGDNDEVSLIKEEIKKIDAEFAALLEDDREHIYEKISDYIIDNKALFLSK